MKMPRFTPYLGIAAGLILGSFIITLLNNTETIYAPLPVGIPEISPTPPTTPAADNAPPTQESPEQTSTEPIKAAATKPAVPAAQTPASVPITAPIAPQPDQVSLDTSASALKNALVNIICSAPIGSGLRSTSGSGVVIDPKGIILTNAHIAQHFLLADRGVSCTIRSGSPAADRYKAALIYIPSAWVRANAKILTKTAPNGTGEYDFALLAISKSVTHLPLPDSFSYVPLATLPPDVGAPVVIASYGAQFLSSNQVVFGLFPTVVFGSIKDMFTFAANTADVLALGGSAAAQEGSSGGGVADTAGSLVGVITTSTITGATDTRSLNAITASYIRGEYASETGEALDLLLAKSLATAIADFAPQISELESVLTANLP